MTNRSYGFDMGRDGIETLAEITREDDGTMLVTIVRLDHHDSAKHGARGGATRRTDSNADDPSSEA